MSVSLRPGGSYELRDVGPFQDGVVGQENVPVCDNSMSSQLLRQFPVFLIRGQLEQARHAPFPVKMATLST